jgi:hypothetical protein
VPLTERRWEDYEAFGARSPAIKPRDLIIDRVAERLAPGFMREAMRRARVITRDGRNAANAAPPPRGPPASLSGQCRSIRLRHSRAASTGIADVETHPDRS